MLKEKLVIKRKAATLITVDFTAPEIVGYAMAWLKLCNVARELKRIWKIENDRSNKVYVWCDPHYKDEMIDFLTGIVYFHKDGKPIPIGKVLDTCDDTIGVPVYLSSDDGFQDILNEGTLELELEDDADPDYVVEVAEWSFC